MRSCALKGKWKVLYKGLIGKPELAPETKSDKTSERGGNGVL